MLGILALTPTERSVKLELMVNRIAQRLSIKEETVWARLKEVRATRKDDRAAPQAAAPGGDELPRQEQSAKPPLHERELVEVLLAEPSLVARAAQDIPPTEMEHPGLRKVIEALYRLHAEGHKADLDHLHGCLDNERLLDKLHDLQSTGLDLPDRPWVYQKVLERFQDRRVQRRKQALLNQLKDAKDDASKLAILKQLKDSNIHGNQQP
jgi:DNA primase